MNGAFSPRTGAFFMPRIENSKLRIENCGKLRLSAEALREPVEPPRLGTLHGLDDSVQALDFGVEALTVFFVFPERNSVSLELIVEPRSLTCEVPSGDLELGASC